MNLVVKKNLTAKLRDGITLKLHKKPKLVYMNAKVKEMPREAENRKKKLKKSDEESSKKHMRIRSQAASTGCFFLK